MAKISTPVLLGFLDENITEKHREQLDFTVNKIGGIPIFPNDFSIDVPKCPLCQLQRPLVIQIYAPLEKPVFHRILYVFGCINPNCWPLSQSWLCLRVQFPQEIDKASEKKISAAGQTDWCNDADVWDTEDSGNIFETGIVNKAVVERGNHLESDFANISVNDKQIDSHRAGDSHLNPSASVATAEIETLDDKDMVILETPTFTEYNVAALLQETTPLPVADVSETVLQFKPYFMSVWPEESCCDEDWASVTDDHVNELLKKYESTTEKVQSPSQEKSGTIATSASEVPENYESSCPAHGDKMFHHFLSRIQLHPEQILRYNRKGTPLLLYPQEDTPNKCQYCENAMTFEFQLVPTIISKLWLDSDEKQVARFDFGTILVYTCQSSCWDKNSKMRIESVVLQKEIY